MLSFVLKSFGFDLVLFFRPKTTFVGSTLLFDPRDEDGIQRTNAALMMSGSWTPSKSGASGDRAIGGFSKRGATEVSSHKLGTPKKVIGKFGERGNNFENDIAGMFF